MWSLAGLLAIFCLVLGFYAANAILANPDEHLRTQPYEYYLYVPKAYTADRSWPVFVGIHGSSSDGRDCWEWWHSYADKAGFILICPTLSNAEGGWYQGEGEEKVNAILLQVGSEYRLELRIFLAGFSAGGKFAQCYTFHYPEMVKGVAVLSAGSYCIPVDSARDIPFLVVLGDREAGRRLDAAQEFVSTLEQNDFNVEYHLLSGVGHTITNETRNLTISFFQELNEKE